MAISDDLNSIRTHLEDDYEALEQLGVSVEDRNIENIKDMANQIYAKFPKTDYEEGSNITLSNTLKGKLDFENDIVGYGDTKQEIDLTENNLTSQSANGLTITVNTDKSITINGTATANTTINILNNTSNNTPATERTLEAGTYQLTGCPSGSDSGTKFKLDVLRSGYIALLDSGSGDIKTLTSSQTYTYFRIQIFSGTQCNNLVFRPKLLKIPSPSYPQEIEVVRGKNLLDSELEKGTYNDNTGEQIATDGNYRNVSPIKVCPNTTYTFSINGVKQKYCVYYYDSSNNFISWIPAETGTFTTPNNCYYINFRCYVADYTSDFANLKIQLEKGSQATSYLPYNTIEEVVGGKNKADLGTFDKEAFGVRSTCQNQKIKYNGTTTSGGNLLPNDFNSYSLGIFKKGTYTASFHYIGGTYTEPSGVGNAFYFRVPSLGIVINTGAGFIVSGWSRTFTLTEDAEVFIQHYVNGAGMVLDNFEYSIQIEEGSTATDYEPYVTPRTYQFSLGNNKFYKIGTYRDYIYKSGDKWYVHKIVEKTPLANKVVARLNTVTSGEYRFTFSLNNAYRSTDPTEVCRNYCNVAKGGTREDTNVQSFDCITYGIDGNDYYLDGVIYLNDTKTMTVEQFNAYASQKNIVLYYQLATPTDTEITDTTLISQLNAWYYAQSIKGTTVITSNGDLPMIIKVRALKGE